jgi:F0F1-type ATP synthase assembly protein I
MVIMLNRIAQDFSQLVSPIKFLFIRNSRRLTYHIIFPGVLAALLFCVQCWLGVPPVEFVSGVTGFLGFLLPTTFLSLVMVTTSTRESLDELTVGEPAPEVMELRRGVKVKESLTRRRYVCLLLGYLVFLQLALVAYGSALISLGYVSVVCSILYHFTLSNLIINALHSFFYFCDRLHRSNN